MWRGIQSKNSFSLKKSDLCYRNIPKIIDERFNIENKGLFYKKYNEAISGDGQEWARIATLHSSSLLALLCFYSVTKEYPLTINNYTFEESFFEVKTRVSETSKSNMDVVLRGYDESRSKVVLFLECKFGEYLNTGKYDNISKSTYENKYKELSLFDVPIEGIVFKNDDNAISITPMNTRKFPIYCGGIKQILSHYIGVSNYLKQRENALEEHKRFKADNEERVMLGEMLFDFPDNISNSKQKILNYRKVYQSLAERVNKLQNNFMLKDIITYQEVFKSYIREENIRKFYMI